MQVRRLWLSVDFVFFLLARDSWNKLRYPLARSSVGFAFFLLARDSWNKLRSPLARSSVDQNLLPLWHISKSEAWGRSNRANSQYHTSEVRLCTLPLLGLYHRLLPRTSTGRTLQRLNCWNRDNTSGSFHLSAESCSEPSHNLRGRKPHSLSRV